MSAGAEQRFAARIDVARPVAQQERVPGDGAFLDDFSDPQPPGRVIGTSIRGGIVRRGVDRERTISIDNGALRIQPLTKPRWGVQGSLTAHTNGAPA
jgi:hypothetical protein